jgi:hypothetical protein
VSPSAVMVGSALFLALLTGHSRTDAAAAERPVSVGFHAGISSAGIHVESPGVPLVGGGIRGTAGIQVAIPRTKRSALQIGTQLRVNAASWDRPWHIYAGDGSLRHLVSHLRLTYVTVPLTVRLSLWEAERGPYAAIGFEPAYLVSATSSMRYLYRWEVGGIAMLGAVFPVAGCRVFGEVTYHHGVSSIWRSKWPPPGNPVNRALDFSIGLQL